MTMYKTNEVPTQDDFMALMQAISEDGKLDQTQPRRRQVSFAPIVTASSAGPLAFDELKDCWYTSNELGIFKSQAKQLARSAHASPQTMLMVADDFRGLEHTTPQRQKHRYMTIRCALSAARQGMTGDQLSSVVRQCTKWSGELAFVQGCHDYCHVYSPQMVSVIPQIPSTPEFPFAVKMKRAADSSTTSRRVRRRVSL